MSYSFSSSETQTFTLTHAKHLASKVSADLKRIQRLYGSPNDSTITSYENELIEFLKKGYLSEVTYGFQRDDKWIEPTLRYTSRDLAGMTADDDDPGKIKPNANISGANFTSYLIKNSTYHNLSSADQESFQNTLPFKRTGAPAPGINGYLSSDRMYSSGGKSLDRSSVKNY
ncbi:MAG: hypothetical protein JWR38_3964 [Mucilaginibacter sp.]|nr:hypothetical protein [Mucilaginibacter sp.]